MTETNNQPRRAPVAGQAGGSARDSQPRADYHFTLATRTGGDPGPAHGLAEAAGAPGGDNSLRQGEFDLPIAAASRPPKTTSEFWQVAIHEAGHAVVAAFYDLAFTEVNVLRTGDRNGVILLDWEEYDALADSRRRVRYTYQVVAMGYAGFFATRTICPAAVARNWCGSAIDWKETKKLLYDLWNTDLYLRRIQKQASPEWRMTKTQVKKVIALQARCLRLLSYRLVDRLFPAIQLVAIALRERQRLTKAEVVAIAGPEIAKLRTSLPTRSWPRPAIARPVMTQVTQPAETSEGLTASGTS